MSIAEKASLWLNDVGKTKYDKLYREAVEALGQERKTQDVEIVFQMLLQDPLLIREISSYDPSQNRNSNDQNPISDENKTRQPSSPRSISDNVEISQPESSDDLVTVSSDSQSSQGLEPPPLPDREDQEEEDEESTLVPVTPSSVPPPLPERETVTVLPDGEVNIAPNLPEREEDETPVPPMRPSTPRKSVSFRKPLVQMQKTEEEQPIKEQEKIPIVKETVCKQTIVVNPNGTKIVKTSEPECTTITKPAEIAVFSKQVSENVKREIDGTVSQTRITKTVEPTGQFLSSETLPPTESKSSETNVEDKKEEPKEIVSPPPELPPRDVSLPELPPRDVIPTETPLATEETSVTQSQSTPSTVPVPSSTLETDSAVVEELLEKRNPPITIVVDDVISPEERRKKDEELVREQEMFKQEQKKEQAMLTQVQGPKVTWITNQEGDDLCLSNYFFAILQSELQRILTSRSWNSKAKELMSRDPRETFACASFQKETFGSDAPNNFIQVLTKFFRIYPVSPEQDVTVIYARNKVGQKKVETRDPWLIVTGSNPDGSIKVESPTIPGAEIQTIVIPYFCFFAVDRTKDFAIQAFPPERLNSGYSSETEKPLYLSAFLVRKELGYTLFLSFKRRYYAYSYPSVEPSGSYDYEELLDMNLGSKVVLYLHRSV